MSQVHSTAIPEPDLDHSALITQGVRCIYSSLQLSNTPTQEHNGGMKKKSVF